MLGDILYQVDAPTGDDDSERNSPADVVNRASAANDQKSHEDEELPNMRFTRFARVSGRVRAHG